MQFIFDRWAGFETQEYAVDIEKSAVQCVPEKTTVSNAVKSVDVVLVVTEFKTGLAALETFWRAESMAPCNLIIVDASFDAAMEEMLLEQALDHPYKWISAIEPGVLPAIQLALDASHSDWVVLLSEYVRVFDSWVDRLCACAQDDVAMITACSNKVTPIYPGLSSQSMAKCFASSVADRGTPIAFPLDGCIMINRKVLDALGGFAIAEYSPGGGELLEFYYTSYRAGYKTVMAESCWVFDSRVGYRNEVAWVPARRQGYYRFLSKYGKDALALQNKQLALVEYPKSIASQFSPKLDDRIDVVFVFREAVVCGLVLAVTEICNALNKIGRWNAYFVCTKFDAPEQKRIPMNFAPVVLDSEVMVRKWISQKRNSVIVSTLWCTTEDVIGSNPHASNALMYFIQDDERRFRHSSGVPYVDPDKVTDSWKAIENRVVNSSWVQRELESIGLKSARIGIGVDIDRFRPRAKSNEPVRIMAHCRPSTPRRGWPFIADVLNKIDCNVEIDVVTYDEPPEGLNVANQAHLGKVSPDELAAQMGTVDIFFEGSEFQGWGMQSLEAMSCGCALVTTNNGGIHEFATPGYDCAMVEYGNLVMATAVIYHLIKNIEERHLMQIRARDSALAFDWREVGIAWDRYLMKVCKSTFTNSKGDKQ